MPDPNARRETDRPLADLARQMAGVALAKCRSVDVLRREHLRIARMARETTPARAATPPAERSPRRPRFDEGGQHGQNHRKRNRQAFRGAVEKERRERCGSELGAETTAR